MAWAATVLCVDADVLEIEPTWVDWGAYRSDAIILAKRKIENRLRYRFRALQVTIGDATDVLDLIDNPEVLKDSACYMTLFLCANANKISSEDIWATRAKDYRLDFEEEWSQAVAMLKVDWDESGDISDDEKYTVDMTATLTRGG